MSAFRFKKFALQHEKSTMKIGTDAVLLAALTEAQDAQSLLDVGCGCGVVTFCMAQKMAHYVEHPLIFGIDPDADSVNEACQNARNYPLLASSCFHFVQTRLQEFALVNPTHRFDLIVSNPPFFGNDLKPVRPNRLKSKHRDNQLSFPELLDGVTKLLSPEGRFALILPKSEGEEFDQLASHRLTCVQRIFVQPTANKPVHRVVMTYSSQLNSPYCERYLVIRGADNCYSDDYQRITKPFLL